MAPFIDLKKSHSTSGQSPPVSACGPFRKPGKAPEYGIEFLPIKPEQEAFSRPQCLVVELRYQRNRCMPHHPLSCTVQFPLYTEWNGRLGIDRHTLSTKGSNAARFRNVCFNNDVPSVNRCYPQLFSGIGGWWWLWVGVVSAIHKDILSISITTYCWMDVNCLWVWCAVFDQGMGCMTTPTYC